VGCFSFYPGKNLGAFGDAGAAVTENDALADRIRLLRDHGRRGRNTHEVVGVNSRLDPLHAAVLTIKLTHIDRWNDARREAAGWYREALPAQMLDPETSDPAADVHHLLPILIEDRDRVAADLAQRGIQTGVHYESTVPSTQAFADPEPFPVAEERARMQLSLPMHPHLTREATAFIAGAVCDALPTAIS
jgi:dTDP-4-amino-4,6-dideoxygalactose transaminase